MATGSVVFLTGMSAWGSPVAATTLRHDRAVTIKAIPITRPMAGIKGTVSATSPNWAGYAVAGKGVTFPDVVGSWTQPAVTCPTSALQESSFWVGLDGYKGSHTVEQIGTHADCDKVKKVKHGVPTYYAWWEMFPGPVNTIGDTVSPGDAMTASVSASGSSFTLSLTDHSRGWSFTITQSSGAALDSSAEWIAESPTGKLADFGSVTFSGLSLTFAPGSSSFNEFLVDMTKKGAGKATTDAISTSSFIVNWNSN